MRSCGGGKSDLVVAEVEDGIIVAHEGISDESVAVRHVTPCKGGVSPCLSPDRAKPTKNGRYAFSSGKTCRITQIEITHVDIERLVAKLDANRGHGGDRTTVNHIEARYASCIGS